MDLPHVPERALNEDRPTVDDLPMLVNRLSLTEHHAPLAIDDVNAAAFAEAYKDLANMDAKVISQ